MSELIKESDLPKKKTTQQLTKMFKEMKGTESASAGLSGVFDLLSFLEPVLRPLEVILQIIGSLFTVMAAEILPPLMEALQPIFDLLISLKPLFIKIGQWIGQVISVVLPPLIDLFIKLFQAIEPLIPKIMEIIESILQLALSALPIIIDVVLNVITIILMVLKPILDWLNSLSPSELAAVIYVLGIGLSALYGLYTGGPWMAAAYAALWAGFMAPLLFLQEGGIITRPVAAEVGHGKRGEIVAPLDEFYAKIDEMTMQQEETNVLLRGIYQDKKFRHDLRRGFR